MVLSDTIYYVHVVDFECTTTCSITLVKMWLRGTRISDRNQIDIDVMEFHPRHKCVVAMKILCRGSIADDTDDSYAMGESTALECVKEFAHTIVNVYEAEYLRPPNQSEAHHILQENEARGFSGMLESIKLHALGMGFLSSGLPWCIYRT
jgi:hypothetical protein